jgi:uncharacterized membrane protein YbhN (UPF0104 family)
MRLSIFTFPGPAQTALLQIGIGVADLGLAALAMYVLISAHVTVDVASAAVAFVLAALLGFISHAPGRLGVFDATMLVALPASQFCCSLSANGARRPRAERFR